MKPPKSVKLPEKRARIIIPAAIKIRSGLSSVQIVFGRTRFPGEALLKTVRWRRQIRGPRDSQCSLTLEGFEPVEPAIINGIVGLFGAYDVSFTAAV